MENKTLSNGPTFFFAVLKNKSTFVVDFSAINDMEIEQMEIKRDLYLKKLIER